MSLENTIINAVDRLIESARTQEEMTDVINMLSDLVSQAEQRQATLPSDSDEPEDDPYKDDVDNADGFDGTNPNDDGE